MRGLFGVTQRRKNSLVRIIAKTSTASFPHLQGYFQKYAGEHGKHRHGRCCSQSLSTRYHTSKWQHIPARLRDVLPRNALSTDEGYMPGRWNAYILPSPEPEPT